MKVLKALVLLLLLSAEAGALEKSYFISKNLANCDKTYNNGGSGTVTESVDFIYDEIEGTLRIAAVFSNEGGATLANGFQFVLTSESSTSFNHYKLPYFYVDGSNLNNVKVRAYTSNRYNEFTRNKKEGTAVITESQFMAQCNNSPGSWDTDGSAYNLTEVIFPPTAGQNNPEWVLAAAASDTTISGKTSRTFSIILDTAKIASFVPNSSIYQYVCSYYGCFPKQGDPVIPGYNLDQSYFDFDNNITLDFIPVVASSVSYGGDALISAYNVSKCSFCRTTLKPTNYAPECQSVTVTPSTVQLGESVDISFKFRDQDTELSDSFKISYAGVPTGATYTRGNNSTFTPGAQEFTAEIEYKPTASDVGRNFTITPALIQLYGKDNTAAVIGNKCIAKFNVIGDVSAPVCETKSQASIMTSLSDNQSKLLKKIQAAQNALLTLKAELKMKAPNLSSKIVQINSEARAIFNSIPEEFNVCTANYGSCDQSDYFPYYKTYMDTFLQLYCQESEAVAYCSGLNNFGGKILKRLIELKAEKAVREGQPLAEAKRAAKNEVNRLYRKKSNKFIGDNFSSIFSEDAEGLHLKLEQFDFQCD